MSVCSLPSPLGSLGEHRELPHWGPAADAFLHILRHIALLVVKKCDFAAQGPDLQNILRQSYDYLTIMPKLRSTYDGRLIYKTSYEGRKAFLRYDSLAKL